MLVKCLVKVPTFRLKLQPSSGESDLNVMKMQFLVVKQCKKKNSFAQLCNPYILFREQNHFRFLILEQH